MTPEAFVPPYPNVEETDVNQLHPGSDSFLQVSLSCKSFTSHVLLKGSKEMEVIECGTGNVGTAVHSLSAEVCK